MHTLFLHILHAVDTPLKFPSAFFLSVTSRLETISIHLMHRFFAVDVATAGADVAVTGVAASAAATSTAVAGIVVTAEGPGVAVVSVAVVGVAAAAVDVITWVLKCFNFFLCC